MKLKTYLRGLGIGIVVTTIVMAITLGGNKEKMSDEEIVARAKELGMVESAAEEPDQNNEDLPEPKDTEEQEPEKKPEPESVPENISEAREEDSGQAETEASEPESIKESETETQSAESVEDVAEPSDDVEVIAGEVVNVSIVNGDDSATVSKRLEELNLVISASQFDRFLCDNGYAKRISPGNYEIAIGSSEETIAKIITKSR